MAFRLDDHVIAGFFMNSHRFSTHGRLLLRGGEMTIAFELTGGPCPDLQGRKIEFEVPGNDHEPSDEDRRLAAALKPYQIGVTGEMTMGRKVKTFECSFEEFERRCALGEPPPTRWELCLYLEWYSQNGRVVIELPFSKIHFPTEAEIAARDQAEKESIAEEMRAAETEHDDPEIETIPEDPSAPDQDLVVPDESSISPGEDDEENYGLIPSELDSELERQARRLDREARGESDETIKMREETELMDEMLEKGEQTPLQDFLVDLDLPSAADVSTEEQAEQALKLALMKLALAGVAFHVCEHCSARDAYRIFIEEVCKDSGQYKPLIGTGWVQNFCTSDYCKKCMGEDAA
jgi:hypothetical protein